MSPEEPDGTELLARAGRAPGGPAVQGRRSSSDGIPFTSFAVDDVHRRVRAPLGRGVRFTQQPTEMGPVTTAVFDDTCGNLIQIAAPT